MALKRPQNTSVKTSVPHVAKREAVVMDEIISASRPQGAEHRVTRLGSVYAHVV